VILTLTQLDYKSNFEENVENTMIQKIITAEKEKYLKPFSSLLLIVFLDSILVSPARIFVETVAPP
jgi:hypothetical protein